tara:strand:- start:107 stop:277 length:171 start_codon:yes stop_codon:yes gene_type:complete
LVRKRGPYEDDLKSFVMSSRITMDYDSVEIVEFREEVWRTIKNSDLVNMFMRGIEK